MSAPTRFSRGLRVVCERILGNIEDDVLAGARLDRELDTVELTWQECAKRFQRKQSRGGRDVGLLLPVGTRLRHGDVVLATSGLLIYVSVIPSEVFVSFAADPLELVTLAYELGDLHCPIEVTNDELVVPADEVMEAFLSERGIAYISESRRFQPHATVSRAGLARDFQIRKISAS